jgi:hypothetical protein
MRYGKNTSKVKHFNMNMSSDKLSFFGLDQYPDLEFYSVEELEDSIIKKYEGQEWEKWIVLKNEYEWLKEAPSYLNYHFPALLQEVIQFQDDDRYIELHLTKPNRKSLAQEILSGNVDENQAVKYLDSAIYILGEYIYPINTENFRIDQLHAEMIIDSFFSKTSLFDLYNKYENQASKDLFINAILKSNTIIVNQTVCPSVSEVFNFIKNRDLSIKPRYKMQTIHGNFYLNNILVEPGSKTQTELITFINPMNFDLQWLYPEKYLGFPVLDFSSLMLNLECYWDEINYGGFEYENGAFGSECKVNFELNTEFSSVYEKGLQFLNTKRGYFAELQGVSEQDFTMIMLCTEWLQLFNKIIEIDRSIFHNQIKTLILLGILGLLGKRLLCYTKNFDAFVFPEKRLELR